MTLDVVKLYYAWLLSADVTMYDEAHNITSAAVNTNIGESLGQVRGRVVKAMGRAPTDPNHAMLHVASAAPDRDSWRCCGGSAQVTQLCFLWRWLNCPPPSPPPPHYPVLVQG